MPVLHNHRNSFAEWRTLMAMYKVEICRGEYLSVTIIDE